MWRKALQHDPKKIDLEPHNWRSERAKPKEPLFGSGLPFFIGTMLALVLAAVAHDYEWGLFGQITAGLLGAVIGSVSASVSGR